MFTTDAFIQRSHLPRLFVVILVAAVFVNNSQITAAHADSSYRLSPLPGEVVTEFRIGEHNWEPGHRGVDLAGNAGDQVLAAATGTISWKGTINGVPMLTIQHPDGLRTTYQPVEGIVEQGQQVATGQVIGVLLAGHLPDRVCLHWGLRDGDSYLDPLIWLHQSNNGEVRLLPGSATPRQQPPPGSFEESEVTPLVGDLPVPGSITSEFGSRINPISGMNEFHDGMDIGAACGTPVQVLWPGTVIFAGVQGGFGNRVEIDHGVIGGVSVQTSYSHLSVISVSVGQQVNAGSVIAQVGTTGYSTGCHLHYSALTSGKLADPRTIGGS